MTELETRRIRVPSGALAVAEAGDPDAPAVVFLHGFEDAAAMWGWYVPMFASWTRAVAPDLLGCGLSDRPPGASLGVTAQARAVGELLTQLGVERAAAVGHAHGGAVAQLLALDGRLDAMVLLDSAAFEAHPPAPDGFDDGERPLAGRESDLGRLEIPTLILWGEDDDLVPFALAERLNDAISTSTLAALPGCGHRLPEEAPETIGPLMFDYLRAKYLGRPHTHGAAGAVPVTLERRRPEEAR